MLPGTRVCRLPARMEGLSVGSRTETIGRVLEGQEELPQSELAQRDVISVRQIVASHQNEPVRNRVGRAGN